MACGRLQERDRLRTVEATAELLSCSAKPVGVTVGLLA
jgi:hypothetical protein